MNIHCKGTDIYLKFLSFFAVITGATDGIGKAYAKQVRFIFDKHNTNISSPARYNSVFHIFSWQNKD